MQAENDARHEPDDRCSLELNLHCPASLLDPVARPQRDTPLCSHNLPFLCTRWMMTGWPRCGGVGVAAGDNPPTTAPSGGSPSSPASSRAEVRPPRTPPHPSYTRARSCLNPPYLLLTCAHHLAPLLVGLCMCRLRPFAWQDTSSRGRRSPRERERRRHPRDLPSASRYARFSHASARNHPSAHSFALHPLALACAHNPC